MRGEVQPSRGAERCKECELGRFAASEGQSACEDCVPGKFSGFGGAFNCSACKVGYVAVSRGSKTCDACAPGKVADNSQTSCNLCDLGTFSLGLGEQRCTACQAGKIAPEMGAQACTSCELNTYPEPGTLARCLPCLENAECLADGTLRNREGYWISSLGKTREAFQCLQGHCVSCPASSRNVTNCCGINRKISSVLCGQCEEGFADWAGECVDCSGGVNWSYSTLVFFASWAYVVFFHRISQVTRSEPKIFLYFLQMSLLFVGNQLDDIAWYGPQSPMASRLLSPLVTT